MPRLASGRKSAGLVQTSSRTDVGTFRRSKRGGIRGRRADRPTIPIAPPARPVRSAPTAGRIAGTVGREGGNRPSAVQVRAARVRPDRGRRSAGVRPRPGRPGWAGKGSKGRSPEGDGVTGAAPPWGPMSPFALHAGQRRSGEPAEQPHHLRPIVPVGNRACDLATVTYDAREFAIARRFRRDPPQCSGRPSSRARGKGSPCRGRSHRKRRCRHARSGPG
jgi:hypothetical protein